jgi:hypothetical protein
VIAGRCWAFEAVAGETLPVGLGGGKEAIRTGALEGVERVVP